MSAFHCYNTVVWNYFQQLSWVCVGGGGGGGGYCWTVRNCLSGKFTLKWRHVRVMTFHRHWQQDCLFNGVFRLTTKRTSKLRITYCEDNPYSTRKEPVKQKTFPYHDFIMFSGWGNWTWGPFWPIEAATKWSQFSRRHFQMYFLV